MKQAFPYVVSTPPSPSVLAISVAQARAQLKLGTDTDMALDADLTLIIGAVTIAAEQYTRRSFITRVFTTYRDRLYGDIILRRNPVQTVQTVKYYKAGVLTLIDPSSYYVTTEPDYFPRICLVDGQSWPSDMDTRKQAVEVVFKCGYGDAASAIPVPLQLGMLQHVAQLWTHRGDNDFPGVLADAAAAKPPAAARALYEKYRILEISA